MPKAAFTLTWSAASDTYEWSAEQGFEVLSLLPDSPAWFAWLAERSSFALHAHQGSSPALAAAVQHAPRASTPWPPGAPLPSHGAPAAGPLAQPHPAPRPGGLRQNHARGRVSRRSWAARPLSLPRR